MGDDDDGARARCPDDEASERASALNWQTST